MFSSVKKNIFFILFYVRNPASLAEGGTGLKEPNQESKMIMIMMISGWYQTLLQFVRVYIQLHWGNQHEAEAGIFGEVTIQVLPQVDQPEGWRDGRK